MKTRYCYSSFCGSRSFKINIVTMVDLKLLLSQSLRRRNRSLCLLKDLVKCDITPVLGDVALKE